MGSATFFGASPEVSPLTPTDFFSMEIQHQGDVAGSTEIPNGADLRGMRVQFGGLSGVTTATAYLCEDADGLIGITPYGTSGATQTISMTGADTGFVSWGLDWRFVKAGGLYMRLKINAGTVDTVRATVYASRDA